jgi:hypothetical protein
MCVSEGFRDFTLGLMVYGRISRELMNASPPQENGYAIFGYGQDCANCIMVFLDSGKHL